MVTEEIEGLEGTGEAIHEGHPGGIQRGTQFAPLGAYLLLGIPFLGLAPNIGEFLEIVIKVAIPFEPIDVADARLGRVHS
jgi:hypothetical protein